MKTPILEARNLAKAFRSGPRLIPILTDVDLTVLAGESVSICGASGSGKSTLLNLLAGLDQPDAGSVFWSGQLLAATLPFRRGAFLGMVFQSFHLVPELDAEENVLLAARIATPDLDAARKRAAALLEHVGLGDRKNHLPGQLSGGECQRVAIARALVNSPRLVLADEPTGNLDERAAAGVVELILGLGAAHGVAVVLVTHNVVQAARTNRRLTLEGGRLSG